MTLDELQQLSPTQAMQAAAKELSLPTDFFDRMWSKESGRGAKMLNPDSLAEGHFQQMPKTRQAWEQRDGRAYDPYNFYEGLYLASRTMRENLSKFKDPVDATRAYNSGWDPSRWGNPETVGYVNALWGAGAQAASRDAGWPTLPSIKPPKEPKTLGPADLIALSNLPGMNGTDADTAASRTAFEQQQTADAAEIARKGAIPTGDVVHEALRDPRDMTGWRAMARYGEDGRQPDLSYDYMARRDTIEAGLTEEERDYLRENAISQRTEASALADIADQRTQDKLYSDAGPWKSTLAHFAAGLADPAGWVAGYGAGKAFQLAGIGHAAMIAAGRPVAAVGALAAENAAANVAITGVSDALGEVKTSADYAGAAAMGVVFSMPFARGVHRQAAEVAARDVAESIRTRAVDEQVNKVASVTGENPGMAPSEVARTVQDRELSDVSKAVREATGPQRIEPVIPEDVRRSMEDEFSGVRPKDEAVSPQAAKEPVPQDVALPEQPNIVEQLRKGEVTRTVSDTSGAEIKLSWVPEPNKLKPHGNLGETLDALLTHPSASIVEKRVAQYLKRVMSDDGLAIDIRFTKRDARSTMNPDGGVAINGTTSGIQSGATDLTVQVHGLTTYGVYSVLHEVVHAATWHRINAWENAAGKLSAAQRKPLSQFQDLFDRYKESVSNGLPGATIDHGAKYAATNLHEFAAQILTDAETRQVLSVLPGKPVAGKASTALREVMSLFRKILGLDKNTTAFHEAAKLVDQIIAMPVDNIHFKDGTPVFAAPHATETPKFHKWFGDSKVVDEQGKPLVVYHGTTVDFNAFDQLGFGVGHFTSDTKVASEFAKDINGHSAEGRVLPVYLKIENPLRIKDHGGTHRSAYAVAETLVEQGVLPKDYVNDAFHTRLIEGALGDSAKFEENGAKELHRIQRIIESEGYDGIVYKNTGEGGGDSWIPFHAEQVKSSIGNSGAFDGSKPGLVEAGADVPGSNPVTAQRARDLWAEKMTAYAQQYMARHPIQLERLKVITNKIGGTSDGLILAGSKNPIMQLVASLVSETTTGAAGREANVALRSHSLHTKFVGNSMLDYDNAYKVYRNRNNGGVIEDMWSGNTRRRFDQAVMEETLSRRYADYTPHREQSVVEAADSLEKLFDRSREAQKDAGVLGHAYLPESSRGYMPQALDGVKLQAATPQDLGLLHGALAEQFQKRLGWDEKFARDFAPFYTERVRRRSMGDKGIDGLGAGGEGLQVVRDTLDEMGQDPGLVDRGLAGTSSQGQAHTRARLDVDLLAQLRPGLRMMDFYVTNPLVLARSYSKRSAGTVALTEAGIHGIRGVRELRQATLYRSAEQPSLKELGAFDRVVSEIMGTPVAGQVISSGATNMGLLVSLQRLGGLVFTQAAETFNMLHHTGWRSIINGVPLIAEKLGEVGRLRRGMPSNNHILSSFEVYGGELGMESYKMVAPLDAPDAALRQYVDQPGLVSRVMRSGQHLQSKISGFRGFMAAQHRMVAEQIVMKAARFVRDGKSDIALRDMGITPEIAASLKGDLDRVAKWDEHDNLVSFDLSQVSDARTAEALMQAVHRGTGQIIQQAFVGERNAWFHNDFLKLLLQLRTFGLTATEKQWGRTRMNHGYAYAGGIMLGQMGLSALIYGAKVNLMAAGMKDDVKRKFIHDSLTPGAVVKATMNYASITGNTGDVLELLTGIAGGWVKDQKTKDMLGVGSQTTSTRSLVPAAATVDQMLAVASGKSNLHSALKQLPFSNLWYIAPAINITRDK